MLNCPVLWELLSVTGVTQCCYLVFQEKRGEAGYSLDCFL